MLLGICILLVGCTAYCQQAVDSLPLAVDSVVVSDSLESVEGVRPGEEEISEQIVQHGAESVESATSDVSPIDNPLPGRAPQVGILGLRTRVFRKLQPSSGFTRGRYIGNSLMFYQRARMSYGDHISAGLVFQKDPGEPRINDFTSSFVSLKHLGILQTMVLGLTNCPLIATTGSACSSTRRFSPIGFPAHSLRMQPLFRKFVCQHDRSV
jgi:hypothetical protein